MKTHRIAFLLLIQVLLLQACGREEPAPEKYTFQLTWSGLGSGGKSGISPRNHFIKFKIDSREQAFVIQLSATDGTKLVASLVRPQLTLPWDITSSDGSNLPLGSPSSSYEYKFTQFSPGEYVLIVGTEQPNVQAAYTLTIEGVRERPTQTMFNQVTLLGETWSQFGGAGYSVGEEPSPRNARYPLEVLENNSYVDVSVVSKGQKLNWVLFDTLGRTAHYGNLSQFSSGVPYLKKGLYSLMVFPERRAENGQFDVWLTGNLKQTQRETTPLLVADGTWEQAIERQPEARTSSGDGFLVYEFEVLKESAVDISLMRKDWIGLFGLFSSSGQRIGAVQSSVSTEAHQTVRLQKGKYYVVLAVNSLKYPTFKLVVVGNVGALSRR